MSQVQRLFALGFAVVCGILLGMLFGTTLGFFVSGYWQPADPEAPPWDYLQSWPYMLEVAMIRGKGILCGGMLGALAGGIGGMFLGNKVNSASHQTATLE